MSMKGKQNIEMGFFKTDLRTIPNWTEQPEPIFYVELLLLDL